MKLRHYTVLPTHCPVCNGNFYPFLRFQVSVRPRLRDYWQMLKALLLNGEDPKERSCLICWSCKNVVGFEEIQ